MDRSSYEFEGEPYFGFLIMTILGGILGTGIFTLFFYAVLNVQGLWVPVLFGFLSFLIFLFLQIKWVYHNIGYHGRNVVIACIFAFLIFFWYGVGQELGGRSFFINLF